MTPAGIEAATFRFVVQHLNHCATAVPNMYRGWTQTDYQNKHYNINQTDEEHRTTEEEMEGPTSS